MFKENQQKRLTRGLRSAGVIKNEKGQFHAPLSPIPKID
jgi:hypothetical protein